MNGDQLLRIGELSKRSGVSPELLRAWERRYDLLRPTRSSGGLRLYSLEDLERVRMMREHIDGGLAAAEAAALVSGLPAATASAAGLGAGPAARAELAEAVDAFDEPAAQGVIDRQLAATTLDAFLGDFVLPYLRELGDRWAGGTASIAQEHFATGVLRGRLLGLSRGWGLGLGPLALLACLPDEQHELGLVAFGLLLRSRGWRIGYLGGDTPLETLDRAARKLRPELVVLSTVAADRLRESAEEVRALAERHRVAVGGRGAEALAETDTGALELSADMVAEAAHVTALAQRARS